MSIWLKALIVLIWLSVPVAGSLMVRNSYQHYLDECLIQRQDCQDRADFLATYCDAYSKLANSAGGISNQFEHRTWVQEFRAIEKWESVAAAKLRQTEPVHFPTADAELGELEADLRELRNNAREAAYYKLDYINAGARLSTRQGMVDELERSSYYYKQTGMAGIYFQLQEDLAMVEDEVRTIRRQRRTYHGLVNDSQSDVAGFKKNIQRGIAHLQDKIDRDEDQTYRQELSLRLADFNPLEDLKTLVFGKVQTF